MLGLYLCFPLPCLGVAQDRWSSSRDGRPLCVKGRKRVMSHVTVKVGPASMSLSGCLQGMCLMEAASGRALLGPA